MLAACNQVLLITRNENAHNCCTLNGHVIVVLICSILPLLLQPTMFLLRMLRTPIGGFRGGAEGAAAPVFVLYS